MRLAQVLSLLAVVMAAPGCALTTDTVPFDYQSASANAPMPGAAQVVVQVTVADTRGGNPQQIAVKKNGFGMEMAPILANRPVADIVRDALGEELRKRGFQIGQGPVTAAVEVNRFVNDYKVGFWSADAVGQVTLAAQVRTSDGRILYSRTLTADGTEGGVMLMTGENARLALQRALPAVLSQLMADQAFIRALMTGGSDGRPIM